MGVSSHNTILLFDGVCNLCNQAVKFIIPRDPQRNFRFASLQSNTGQRLLQQYGLPSDTLNSVILLDNGKAYTKSSAALRVARKLGGIWSLLYVFIMVPRPLRDIIYNWVARNRYRWFGKRETCMLPPPDIGERFLK
ncbi:thiol-disulfide oxidoreductase DCC family protein [Aneurinibacillus thermoaerophilus]|uniref:Predicted thiol-disulfide oxidoreductase YuxK, DCC family n=1 Tax=Aneurinibacillus thermoaerophilus TaxID=143495 RepID=A0A1G8CQT6_ANETH|nr:thiol-disulfide oxidoreductase DCC family protein [Aneurinibacillus thermoaerophilus]MED0677204.1 thiol-disulfide oxidoreductase DCC family protein [Aneurinibacillus thermoaerophilus]MED0680488.1 thiol-disulfide oxidoreductase DCC family protein [Aneurinibacillus thermoaerophilus]MED0757933.1 thiol-disulfide oxidoreductase DCC family protein [Aneurinibacillus thermoaerophilus]MED0761631.1 thiol-disulfide oxidoreductase DCC family protein [Aneurinibacillus thermoaerophilus]MED0764872.1 thiol